MSEEIKPVEQTENIAAPAENAEAVTEPAPRAPYHEKPARNGYRERGEQKVGVQSMPRFKKKQCRFCYSKDIIIDYKNTDILERFITDRGKILPRRITGTCSKHQRLLARAIKRARIIALLPFIVK